VGGAVGENYQVMELNFLVSDLGEGKYLWDFMGERLIVLSEIFLFKLSELR
jgi:hypothetical protein